MAFYDYICKDCGRIFEVQKGMNETYTPECEFCKSTNTARKFNKIARMAGRSADLDHEGHEHSGSCSSCSSGVCSSCSSKG